jgi:hypothetical protein
MLTYNHQKNAAHAINPGGIKTELIYDEQHTDKR